MRVLLALLAGADPAWLSVWAASFKGKPDDGRSRIMGLWNEIFFRMKYPVIALAVWLSSAVGTSLL